MKKTYALILIVTLIATIKADYFAGIVADQKLVTDTNNAINSLKDTLITDFDCQYKTKRKMQQSLGGTVVLGPNSNGQAKKQSVPFDSSNGINKKQELYQKCIIVAQYLQKIKEVFKGFNNVILGSQNKVNGNKNFVAGSRDNINGNNNWFFTSDLTLNTVQDGVIIIENYLIEVAAIHMIPKNPNQAIRCISTDDSNGKLRKWWGEAHSRRRVRI